MSPAATFPSSGGRQRWNVPPDRSGNSNNINHHNKIRRKPSVEWTMPSQPYYNVAPPVVRINSPVSARFDRNNLSSSNNGSIVIIDDDEDVPVKIGGADFGSLALDVSQGDVVAQSTKDYHLPLISSGALSSSSQALPQGTLPLSSSYLAQGGPTVNTIQMYTTACSSKSINTTSQSPSNNNNNVVPMTTTNTHLEGNQINQNLPMCTEILVSTDTKGGGGKLAKSQAFCPLCSKTFQSRFVLKMHMSRVHGESASNSLLMWGCPMCKNEKFSGKWAYHDHFKTAHADNICTACNKSLASRQGLLEHINAKHSRKRVYVCNICNAKSYSRQGLFNHRKGIHGLSSSKNKMSMPVFPPQTFTTPTTTSASESSPINIEPILPVAPPISESSPLLIEPKVEVPDVCLTVPIA